jgi:hypothetical protein
MIQHINHKLQWTIHYQNDPEFSHIRFKRIKGSGQTFDFVTGWIDLVTPEEFFTPEPNRLPLFLGTQFGISPHLHLHKEFLTGHLRVAIIAKSQLSGNVAGLFIEDVNLVQSEPKKKYYLWKRVEKIRTFRNQLLEE